MRRVLLAEFESSDACAGAISKLKASGHSELDAYMPFPAKNVEEALALPKTPLPKWVLAGGLTGAALAYFILWWTQNVGYPLDVGSHPTHSVPAYIGITFETAVLFASFTAFLGMLRLCRLPRLYHPVFDVELFYTNRVFIMSCLASLVMYTTTFANVVLVSLYLQYLKGITPSGSS